MKIDFFQLLLKQYLTIYYCQSNFKICNSNQLSLNLNKTQELEICYDRKSQIKCLVGKIPQYFSSKYSRLTRWQLHINYILPKVSRGILMIRKLRQILGSQDVLISIFIMCISTLIQLGTIMWANSSHSNCLFRAKKKAVS